MVIASGVHGERRVLLLGLSEENTRRLRAGHPIRVTPESHPGCPSELEIVIVHGATERAIADALIEREQIDRGTQIVMVARQPEGQMQVCAVDVGRESENWRCIPRRLIRRTPTAQCERGDDA